MHLLSDYWVAFVGFLLVETKPSSQQFINQMHSCRVVHDSFCHCQGCTPNVASVEDIKTSFICCS